MLQAELMYETIREWPRYVKVPFLIAKVHNVSWFIISMKVELPFKKVQVYISQESNSAAITNKSTMILEFKGANIYYLKLKFSAQCKVLLYTQTFSYKCVYMYNALYCEENLNLK